MLNDPATAITPSASPPEQSAQVPQKDSPDAPTIPSPRSLSPAGAFLSYLIPGLGQIAQGRTGKGILFFVCIYTLFFYGLWLGSAEAKVNGRTYRVSGNVYLPQRWIPPELRKKPDPGGGLKDYLLGDLVRRGRILVSYPRPQVAAQFFVGAAFWPAILQYRHEQALDPDPDLDPDGKLVGPYPGNPPRKADEMDAQITRLHKEAESDPDHAAEKLAESRALEKELRSSYHPILGDFMREPTMQATNAVFNAGDKRLELAWVFTVIAGVLNVMVIWDALAGPAYTSPEDARRKAH
jgi:hypothetical protein